MLHYVQLAHCTLHTLHYVQHVQLPDAGDSSFVWGSGAEQRVNDADSGSDALMQRAYAGRPAPTEAEPTPGTRHIEQSVSLGRGSRCC